MTIINLNPKAQGELYALCIDIACSSILKDDDATAKEKLKKGTASMQKCLPGVKPREVSSFVRKVVVEFLKLFDEAKLKDARTKEVRKYVDYCEKMFGADRAEAVLCITAGKPFRD